jgi:hypothetical protein
MEILLLKIELQESFGLLRDLFIVLVETAASVEYDIDRFKRDETGLQIIFVSSLFG